MILHAARLSRAPVAALTAIGFMWGGFAGVVPDIKAAVGASEAQLGLALLCSSIGAMGSMYLTPRLYPLFGRFALPAFGVLLAAAFFFPLLAPSVPALALAMFATGASVSLLDITANIRISELETRHRIHLMNGNHAMFSVGFAAAAFFAGLMRRQGAGPWDILPWLSLASVLLAVVMIDRRAPEPPHRDPSAPKVTPPWLAIGLTAAVLFAAFVGENATEAWSALHIEETLGAPAGQGSFGPFMLGLTMAIGRFSGQFVADRIGEARLILGSAILGLIGALMLAGAPNTTVAFLAVAVLGAGMAVIVPSVNSILGKIVREESRAHAISRAWMVGMVGFFVGPAMIGAIAEATSLRWSFVFVALIVSAAIPAVIRLDRLAKGRQGGAVPA